MLNGVLDSYDILKICYDMINCDLRTCIKGMHHFAICTYIKGLILYKDRFVLLKVIRVVLCVSSRIQVKFGIDIP